MELDRTLPPSLQREIGLKPATASSDDQAPREFNEMTQPTQTNPNDLVNAVASEVTKTIDQKTAAAATAQKITDLESANATLTKTNESLSAKVEKLQADAEAAKTQAETVKAEAEKAKAEAEKQVAEAQKARDEAKAELAKVALETTIAKRNADIDKMKGDDEKKKKLKDKAKATREDGSLVLDEEAWATIVEASEPAEAADPTEEGATKDDAAGSPAQPDLEAAAEAGMQQALAALAGGTASKETDKNLKAKYAKMFAAK